MERREFGIRTFLSCEVVDWTALVVEEVDCDRVADNVIVSPATDFKITLVIGGQADVESFRGGRWWRATYRLGAVGMTSPGRSAHLRWRTTAGVLRTVHLSVPLATMAAAAVQLGHRSFTPDALPDTLAVSDPVIGAVTNAVRHAARNGVDDLYAQAAADFLAIHVLSNNYPGRDKSVDLSSGRLTEIVEFVHDNLDARFGLADLADLAGMSTFHFSRVFSAEMGASPHQYVLGARLDASRRMLDSTTSLVSTVARSFGFSSASHFAAAFRKRFGVSPSEYRCRA